MWRYFEVKFAVVLLGGLAVAWAFSRLFEWAILEGSGPYAFAFAFLFPCIYLAGLTVGMYRAQKARKQKGAGGL